MDYFACDNPVCKFHIPISKKEDDKPYFIYREPIILQKTPVIKDVKVNRYLYVDRKEDRRLFLCETCHSAVELITGSTGKQ